MAFSNPPDELSILGDVNRIRHVYVNNSSKTFVVWLAKINLSSYQFVIRDYSLPIGSELVIDVIDTIANFSVTTISDTSNEIIIAWESNADIKYIIYDTLLSLITTSVTTLYNGSLPLVYRSDSDKILYTLDDILKLRIPITDIDESDLSIYTDYIINDFDTAIKSTSVSKLHYIGEHSLNVNNAMPMDITNAVLLWDCTLIGSRLNDLTGNGNYGHLDIELFQFKMNDDAANTIVENSFGADGVLVGANTEDISVVGKINKALEFTGDYVDSNYAIVKDSGTLCTWVKPVNTGQSSIIAVGSQASNHRCYLGHNGSGIYGAGFGDTSYTTISSGITPTSGVWAWLILMWAGTDVKLYVDNVLRYRNYLTISGDAKSGLNLFIGAHNTGTASNRYNGAIDDTRLYGKELTEYQRNTLWNGGSGTEDQLVSPVYVIGKNELLFDNEGVIQIKNFAVPTSITIEAWIIPAFRGRNSYILADDNQLWFGFTSENEVFFGFENASRHEYISDKGQYQSYKIRPGFKNHFAVTHTFGTAANTKIVINGTEVNGIWSIGDGTYDPGFTNIYSSMQLNVGDMLYSFRVSNVIKTITNIYNHVKGRIQ